MRSLVFAAVLAAFCGPAVAQPRIAIIIDDLGYELAAGQRAIALPGPVVCAILPDAPRAEWLAQACNAEGKEVVLHLPMQAANFSGQTEPQSLTIDMSRSGFAATFEEAFEAVPFAIGINNHRGSLLTRHPGHMRWLMEEIRALDNVFFVDSFTTEHSVAMQMAGETGVTALRRDVFLDPEPTLEVVEREFERLKAIAMERGVAVAIGHPHDVTLGFLEHALPELASEGFELVPLSSLTELRTDDEGPTLRVARDDGAERLTDSPFSQHSLQ